MLSFGKGDLQVSEEADHRELSDGERDPSELEVSSEEQHVLGFQAKAKAVQCVSSTSTSALDVFPVLDVSSDKPQELGVEAQVQGQQGSGHSDTKGNSALDMSREEPPELQDTYCEGLFSQACVGLVETQAQQALEDQVYAHHRCEEILGQLTFPSKSQSRNLVQGKEPQYMVLGAYAHGNHYGITR